MTKTSLLRRLTDRRGSTLIFVAVAMVVLLSVAALAIDVGYLYVVRNELQNAADSGALAGAQVLYNSTGTAVNTDADVTALNYVQSHLSEQATVQVQSVERGHWSFATKTFTANASTATVALWDVTTAQLDANTDFINAVRVVTTRKTVAGAPEQPFFARVFGAAGPTITATAVGYIGFAGTIEPSKLDQPIAICQQSILSGGTGPYTCGVGRMISSSSGAGSETGGWTNFSQPCSTPGGSDVPSLVCSTGNTTAVTLGVGMGTTNGMVQTAYNGLDACWKGLTTLDSNGDGIPDKPWSMTLPVVDCSGNAVGNCSTVVGAVTVDVVWITETDKTKFKEVPRRMFNPTTKTVWTCSTADTSKAGGQQCWNEFVTAFNLKDILAGTAATYEDKTIYFLPDCTPHETIGTTGGANFGTLARIPVLVK
jgi:Flp pilus assembly protein TadG